MSLVDTEEDIHVNMPPKSVRKGYWVEKEAYDNLKQERDTLREALRLMSEAKAVEHECYLAPPDHGLKKPMDDKCIDCDRHEKEIAICLYNHFIAQAKGVE